MSRPADRLEMAFHRILPDEREVGVYPQPFSAQLFVGGADDDGFDDAW